MKLHKFSSAIKEIVLTSVAALLLFSLAAAQSADALEYQDKIQEEISKRIHLVTLSEADYLEKYKALEIADLDFKAGTATLTELFKAQVSLNEAEERVMNARTVLLLTLAKVDTRGNQTLAFNQAL